MSDLTQTPLSRSKVKVTIITALVYQAAAALGVGTCWLWETAAMLPSARQRSALALMGGGEVGAYRGGRPPNLGIKWPQTVDCCQQFVGLILICFALPQ